MNKEKTYKIIRSLIISCNPQDGLPLWRLLSDFREIVGTTVPIFEFNDTIEFLQASREFDIDYSGGECTIYAKTSAKSKHISKFVAEQNKPRAYRERFSVQNRISTNYTVNDSVNSRKSQSRIDQKTCQPPSLHRAVSTVEFSFEQLKSKQKENNDDKRCNAVSTVVFSFEQLKLQHKEKANSKSNQPANNANQLNHSSEGKDGRNVIDPHREITKQTSDGFAVPELKTNILTSVAISHISDGGDIFIHLKPSGGMDYVKQLIMQFIRKVSNNPIVPFEKVVPISDAHLFVVQDPETNQLCRAKVINETDNGSNMFFIDYGHSKLIPSSKMYLIDTGYHNEEIYRYPPQVIRTKLSGVNESAIESSAQRLRSHFSLKRTAYVRKIQSNAIVPEVKLYFDAESFMVCVNDSLEWETERSQMLTGTNNRNAYDASDTANILCNTHSIVDRTFVETSFTSSEAPKIETFLPPKLNCCFEIEIVKIGSPSSFVIKPTEHIPQWQKQMKALQIYCKEPSVTLTMDLIREGEPYACLKSNGFWYRAIIKFHRGTMYAFYCDTAEIDIIDNLKYIKVLPKEYCSIPKLAMTAKLFGVEPANGKWQMDDNVKFNLFTKGKRFLAEVVNVKSDGNLEIVLKHNEKVINDLWIASGRAIKAT